MADKDKHETATPEPIGAPAKKEAPPPPKLSKEELGAQLLASYQHNMEHASPRNVAELQMIRDLVAAK